MYRRRWYSRLSCNLGWDEMLIIGLLVLTIGSCIWLVSYSIDHPEMMVEETSDADSAILFSTMTASQIAAQQSMIQSVQRSSVQINRITTPVIRSTPISVRTR